MSRVILALLIPVILYSIDACGKTSRQDEYSNSVWIPDNGDGTYRNPVIFADYSDPDVVRVGDDFYMVASSFNCSPGMPVLHSRDLVNWKIIGHVFEKQQPDSVFNTPQHGKGCWAPSIRYYQGYFWVYYGDPDFGIYMTKSENPEGPWDPLYLVKKAKGWIDPCPFWDEDGKAYLVHAWAKSRVGFNSVLTLNRMSPDGKKILDEGTMIFDGHADHPTIEGPKFYKRNGYYYIFAPAGGVKPGWQTILRSKDIFGPYEDKIALEQGSTNINGPHQGGWVELTSGESWFVHFQDCGAYGRIVHLQPVFWDNDWPKMGLDKDGNGIGEPVDSYKKPGVGRSYPVQTPQTSDEFENEKLGLQWQWHANYQNQWWSLTERQGCLRLFNVTLPENTINLWQVPNLILQKFPAPEFTVTTLVDPELKNSDDKAGLIIMGRNYAYLSVQPGDGKNYLSLKFCKDADQKGLEQEIKSISISEGPIYLRVRVGNEARCQFSYGKDGERFHELGKIFEARAGRWIGAKVGLFATTSQYTESESYIDVEWFRFE